MEEGRRGACAVVPIMFNLTCRCRSTICKKTSTSLVRGTRVEEGRRGACTVVPIMFNLTCRCRSTICKKMTMSLVRGTTEWRRAGEGHAQWYL